MSAPAVAARAAPPALPTFPARPASPNFNDGFDVAGPSSTACPSRAAVTDAAFAHLAGIHTLDISRCNQRMITDAAFAHLRGIRTLTTSFCAPAVVAAAADLLAHRAA